LRLISQCPRVTCLEHSVHRIIGQDSAAATLQAFSIRVQGVKGS
jgi:hypothetical protein